MNKNISITLLFMIVFAAGTAQAQQNVGIGTASPDASALLDINSTTKGLLIPKMTTAQKNALVSPAFGLMLSNTTGNSNVAIGENSLRSNTTGYSNYAVGVDALRSNTAGSHNVAMGDSALYSSVNSANTAIGSKALQINTSGINNTALGFNAGNTITSGSNNIAIGQGAQVAVGTNSNQIRLGNGLITKADIQVAWTVTSDARFKRNINTLPSSLSLINALRPVNYQRINDNDPNRFENGFIAQELEASLIKLGLPVDGMISKDDKGYYSIRYNDFIPVLVKGMQEQQATIEKQDQKLSDLQKQIDELKKLITTKN